MLKSLYRSLRSPTLQHTTLKIANLEWRTGPSLIRDGQKTKFRPSITVLRLNFYIIVMQIFEKRAELIFVLFSARNCISESRHNSTTAIARIMHTGLCVPPKFDTTLRDSVHEVITWKVNYGYYINNITNTSMCINNTIYNIVDIWNNKRYKRSKGGSQNNKWTKRKRRK